MSYITNDVAALQAALVDSLIELVTESSILIGSLVMMFVFGLEIEFSYVDSCTIDWASYENFR